MPNQAVDRKPSLREVQRFEHNQLQGAFGVTIYDFVFVALTPAAGAIRPRDMTHILLIDDEPAITESLAYAFSRVGMTSESASSLCQATERLNASPFDLIILDLMLPDGNGLDWLKAVRAESNIPVIILSSHDETVDQVVGLEVGADDYVGKPFLREQ